MKNKPKQPKAPWTRIKTAGFKAQQEKLRPEDGRAGGMKWRSKSKEMADAVYKGINELFASVHPHCEACHLIWPEDSTALNLHWRDDTHHMRGKDGLLYFDVRDFKSVCRKAHAWIGDHPTEAKQLGLLKDRNL